MLIVDSHVHIWAANTPERPWPARHKPHRPEPFSSSDQLREMNAAGVDAAVIVPPSWEGERNDLGLEAARLHPHRFAVMGRMDTDAPSALSTLKNWRNQPGMLGLRLAFNTPHLLSMLTEGRLEWLWTGAEEAGIPVMVRVLHPLVHHIDAVAARHPGLRLVMDHMAMPMQLKQCAAVYAAAQRAVQPRETPLTMPIKAVEPQRLYRRIAEQIERLIRRGEYKPGARLPPERDLARMLKVSRPSVREALIALEVEGYVEVRVGSGVYVTRQRPAARGVDSLPPDSGPFELIAARRLLESECAALAARHAGPAQVRRMKAALAAMERDRRRSQMPLDNDRRFHLEIAEASGNSALALAVRTLWDQRTGPLFLRLEHHFDTPELWDAAIAEHTAVMAANEKHDANGARGAMRSHRDAAARRFKRSWSAGARD